MTSDWNIHLQGPNAAEWRDITHYMYMRAVRQCIDIGYADGAYVYARISAAYALRHDYKTTDYRRLIT